MRKTPSAQAGMQYTAPSAARTPRSHLNFPGSRGPGSMVTDPVSRSSRRTDSAAAGTPSRAVPSTVNAPPRYLRPLPSCGPQSSTRASPYAARRAARRAGGKRGGDTIVGRCLFVSTPRGCEENSFSNSHISCAWLGRDHKPIHSLLYVAVMLFSLPACVGLVLPVGPRIPAIVQQPYRGPVLPRLCDDGIIDVEGDDATYAACMVSTPQTHLSPRIMLSPSPLFVFCL